MKSVAKENSRIGLRPRRCLIALFMAGASASDAAIFEVNTSTDPAVPITVGCDATECTLREAITAANALAGADEVHFEIAGSGERLIALTSPLPNITQTLKVDGYTQSGTSENSAATTSDAILLVRIDGSGAGASAIGVRICAPNSVVQGLAMTGFAVAAIGAGGSGCNTSSGSVIRGNFFGLTTDGITAASNTGDAMSLQSSVYTVGGPNPADRNVIASSANGVFIQNSTTAGSVVLNNLIGTDRSGTLNRGNVSRGIVLGSSANNIVVGSDPAPNLIAFNQRGIITTSGSGNQVLHNRIHSNLQLGIDHANNGLTANDTDDVDTGPNALQNFPVIASATVGSGAIDVAGTLDVGHAGAVNYTLGLYVSDRCDTSGHGEGERIIGVGNATLSTSVEAFALSFSTSEPFVGRVFLTMTATHPVDGTSEFSQCFNVNPDVPLIVNSTDDVGDSVCDATHCSLRDAITEANGVAGLDLISFNIPGAGPHYIILTSPLPTIAGATTIDGYSEPGASANTHPSASNAVLKIVIDAGGYSTGSGGVFNLSNANAAGSAIRGLSVVDARGGAPAVLLNVDADIEGNWFGIEPDGVTTGGSLAGPAVRIAGIGMTIGGALPAQRNVFAASTSSFGAINGIAASSNVLIENNLVGLRPDGVTGQTNLNGLLWSGGAQSNVVVRNNTISCNSGSLFGFGTLVENNSFGTSSDGSTVPASCTPNGRAVPANGARWVGNLFAFHTARAVEVGAGNAASFSRNRFIANVTYDLDLNADGHSANDALDVDGGGNGTQNFPLLTTARRLSDTQLEISGTLNSLASTTFTIEFFGNSATTRTALGGTVLLADARWVGSESISVTTDAAGVASFGPTTVNFPTAVKVNVVSATATRLDGASNPLETSEVGPAISSFAAGGADLVVTNTLASGEGSFFAAVNEANARPDTGAQRDRITFNIPGAGPHLITPTLTSLNLIDRIEIDGYSQPGTAMNSLAVGSNAVIAIELRNISLDFSGASDVLIRGISIDGTPPSPQPYLRLNGNSVLEGSFIGIAFNGTTLLSNLANGTPAIACSSSGCGRIGGVAVSARNLLGVLASANNATVLTSATAPSLIRNNLIGMRRDGMTRLITNATNSLGIHSQSTTGPAAGDTIQDNVIGGLGVGIRIGGNGAIVTGNFIGIGGNGTTAAANNAQGILVAAGSAHTISSNTVGSNGGDGIELASTASAVALIDNRIFANNGLGIDLDGDGVTANDAGDGDVGANARQNFPVLASALHDIDGVVLSGTLNSLPESDFRVRFCLVQGNSDSHGECTAPAIATFVDVHTDGSGNASFVSPPIPFVVNMTHASASAARLVAGGEETSELAQTIAIRRVANIAIQSFAPASVRFGEQFTTSVLVGTPIAGSAPAGSVAITRHPMSAAARSRA